MTDFPTQRFQRAGVTANAIADLQAAWVLLSPAVQDAEALRIEGMSDGEILAITSFPASGGAVVQTQGPDGQLIVVEEGGGGSLATGSVITGVTASTVLVADSSGKLQSGPGSSSVVNATGATNGDVPIANGNNGYAWGPQTGGSGSGPTQVAQLGNATSTLTMQSASTYGMQVAALTVTGCTIQPPTAVAGASVRLFLSDPTGGLQFSFGGSVNYPRGAPVPVSSPGMNVLTLDCEDGATWNVYPETSGPAILSGTSLSISGGDGGRFLGYQHTGVAPTQASPAINDWWIDRAVPCIFLWNGTAWAQIGGSGGGGVSITSPDSSVVVGGTASAPTLQVATTIPRLTGSPGPYQRAGYDPTLGEWIPVSPGWVPLAQHFNISPANADNSAAIMVAAQAMYNDGLKGELPPGVLKIKSQLVFGNGSSTSLSTWAPYLRGASVPAKNGYSNACNTTIQWANGTGFGSPLVVLQGPFQGWELSRLTIDGNSSYSSGPPLMGLQLVSVQNGNGDFLVVTNSKSGIQHTTVGVKNVAGVSANCSNNDLRSVMVAFTGASVTSFGVQFTEGSGGGGNGNCCYEDYEDLWIQQTTGVGGANPRFGLYFQRCDSNRIHNLHIANGGMAASIVYDYQSYNIWPAGNVIDGHVELGGANCPVLELGAPAQSTTSGAGTKNVIMIPPSCVNGSSPDPSITPGVSSDSTYNTQNGNTNVGLSQNVTWGEPYLHGEVTLSAGTKNVGCKFAITGTPVHVWRVAVGGTPGAIVQGVVSANGTISITSYQSDGATVQTADTGTYFWRLIR